MSEPHAAPNTLDPQPLPPEAIHAPAAEAAMQHRELAFVAKWHIEISIYLICINKVSFEPSWPLI